VKPVDRRLLRTTRAARTHLGVTVAAGAAAAVLIVAGAAILARVITDVFLRGSDLADVAPLLVALGVIALARGALSWGSEVSAARGAARVMSELRLQVAAHALRRRPTGLGSERRGELASEAVQGVDHL
jgi:ABC-type transport system involved in cytochrome bd biosynthesis fused ATPase/permease subunit